MDKKQKRRFAFQDYMRKWHMSDYRAFVYKFIRTYKIYLVHKKVSTRVITIKATVYFNLQFIPDSDRNISEIVALSTFLKCFQSRDVEVIVYEDNDTYQSFYSLNEVKEYMLIQKIAGV